MKPKTLFPLLGAFCLAASFAYAAVTWYAVDPMSERQFLPDAPPAEGLEGAPVRIVAAQGEYEPGSFVVTSDADVGKVDFTVSSLKAEDGASIPASEIDLATAKVWYQAGNAWFSYFQDTSLKLCPELLLHDEDLVKVDERKVANYARLTEKDGSVRYHWLTPPRQVENRIEDTPRVGFNLDDAFLSMKENFQDTPSFAGATIEKGRYKQFLVTVHVGKDVKPGLYAGEIALRRREGGADLGAIPLRLRVLPFELPEPCTYFDWNKEFRTWFCEYISLNAIEAINGGDRALAERQLRAILADFVRHNETIPSFAERVDRPEFAREAGMDLQHAVIGGMHLSWNRADMRYAARRLRAKAERAAGKPLDGYACWEAHSAKSARWSKSTTTKASSSQSTRAMATRPAAIWPTSTGRRSAPTSPRRRPRSISTTSAAEVISAGTHSSTSASKTPRTSAASTASARTAPECRATTTTPTILAVGTTSRRACTAR